MTTVILVLALAVGLYMAWSIGGNDVANAMGTSVGSGAVTLGGALLIAGIFEFSGSVLVGSHVTETIRSRILETSMFAADGPLGGDGPFLLALGMSGSLLAAALWLQFATLIGMPVSTTHSIVGAVVGFGLVAVGFRGIAWGKIVFIAGSWVVSPAMGGTLAFLTFVWLRHAVLRQADPVEATRRVAPYLALLVGTILSLSFIYKALANVVRDPHPAVAVLAALAVGGLAAIVAREVAARRLANPGGDGDPYAHVERLFGRLQIATAAYVAFAHGANDVANAVGPVAAVVGIVGANFAEVPTRVPVSRWLLAAGGFGIVLGLATLGYRVIATIGRHITEITPTRGFSAEFGAATTVLIASRLGLPVSTTHTLVGAVIGVGFAHGIAALNLRVLRRIIVSWIAEVPVAALLSALFFLLLRAVFL
ncbi:MAG: inorganic phosphate transporter [Gemmatimonadetes bacterium]|nr:inorganic phosphate transporter [Gemmatimonadota bacterium]